MVVGSIPTRPTIFPGPNKRSSAERGRAVCCTRNLLTKACCLAPMRRSPFAIRRGSRHDAPSELENTFKVACPIRATGRFDPDSEIYNHYIKTSTITFEVDPVTASEMERAFASSGLSYLVGASDGSDLLGFAYGSRWKSRAAYQHSSEITAYVRPGLERAGVGSALYSQLLPALKAIGVRTVIGGGKVATGTDEPSALRPMVMLFTIDAFR